MAGARLRRSLRSVAATAWFLGCFLAVGATAFGLNDPIVVGSSVFSLDGDGWIAERLDAASAHLRGGAPIVADISIQATVPGDLITDLQRAGMIGDPLFENNFLADSPIWADPAKVWEYSRTFSMSPFPGPDDDVLLIFDGVKMGATVELNGVTVGTMTDQHLRYKFLVTGMLRATENVLKVRFDGTETDGRYMGCSGGWDWAPISNTFEGAGRTFSKGIWKSVYLSTVPAKGAAIVWVVPEVIYRGSHPTEPLVDGQHAGFEVRVRVHLLAGVDGISGAKLEARGYWDDNATSSAAAKVTMEGGEEFTVQLSLGAPASQTKLWWPWDHGEQHLYKLTVSIGGHSASRRIGFRVAAIVTTDDTNADAVLQATDKEGSGDHGMYFRINGAAIMTFGSNMIPMDEMEGRYSAAAHRQVVLSARDGRMNMLRVWGGGVFLPEEFYNAADQLGLLVWQDMMYTTTSKTSGPMETETQLWEIKHNIRRLSSHPCIVLWNACNECKAGGLYTSFVMKHVIEEDRSRPVWPGSPSNGWARGVRRLDGLPTEGSLKERAANGQNTQAIESHGPYGNGNGYATVNQAPVGQLKIHDPMLPIPLKQVETGLGIPSKFVSEFGASVFPSFESLSPTLQQSHWGVHGGMPEADCSTPDRTTDFWRECEGSNVMAQRNYPCDDKILGYFGQYAHVGKTGEYAFKRQLWQCMIGQALLMKSTIELRRSTNVFGLLTWQLNEIWPTGGWGSLEYGTVGEGFTKGQVLGGRWRPLHYWYRQSLYAKRMATCGQDGRCYFRNDRLRAFTGCVEIRALDISSAKGAVSQTWSFPVTLPGGPGEVHWFEVPEWEQYRDGNHVFTSTVSSSDGSVESSHVILPMTPANLNVAATSITLDVGDVEADGSVPVKVTSTAPALYVTLTTKAQGRFSDNCFLMFDDLSITVMFIPFTLAGPLDLQLLNSSIRVEDLYFNTGHTAELGRVSLLGRHGHRQRREG